MALRCIFLVTLMFLASQAESRVLLKAPQTTDVDDEESVNAVNMKKDGTDDQDDEEENKDSTSVNEKEEDEANDEANEEDVVTKTDVATALLSQRRAQRPPPAKAKVHPSCPVCRQCNATCRSCANCVAHCKKCWDWRKANGVGKYAKSKKF